MIEPADLVRDDGVLVPDRLAVEMFRLLRQALMVRTRTTAEVPSAAAIALLKALHIAANRPARVRQPPAGSVEVSVAVAAAALGCSERHVRRQLAAGQLRGHKHGRDWVVACPLADVHDGQSATMDP